MTGGFTMTVTITDRGDRKTTLSVGVDGSIQITQWIREVGEMRGYSATLNADEWDRVQAARNTCLGEFLVRRAQ